MPRTEESAMSEERIHRAVSDDGTEIAGRVHGQGPPLVLVPGVMMDGETVWELLLPLLTDRFTCFALSTRGRGLSGQATDFSPEWLRQDVTSFVDSIGEPVYLAGWSQGARVALAATEQTASVAAVASFEAPVFETGSDELLERFIRTVSHQGELAAEGRLVDAARIFIHDLVTDADEREALPERFYEILAPNIPIHLQEMQALASRGPGEWSATDPDELAKIAVPVLVLFGTRSIPRSWFIDGAHHIAEYVGEPHLRSIEGVGHMAPFLEPRAVADELMAFFAGSDVAV
jgi:pimeloyl-ACP methyl ester carboxylesterase